jgi:citrate synthase
MSEPTVSTAIATSTASDVFIRGKSLCKELIGKVTFTEMIFWGVLGRVPTAPEVQILDACLVTLMEHGLTPSAVVTRLTYSSAPESMQAAVAAGLCSVGSLLVGTMDGAGTLLQRMLRSEAPFEQEALRIAQEHKSARQPVPGFGHPQHKPDDPRALELLALSRSLGVAGKHVAAIEALGKAVDATYARHITLNATGAIAAVLADAQVPYEILRGVALIARCAGLVAHVHEEQQQPALRAIWHAADAAVPYTATPHEAAPREVT